MVVGACNPSYPGGGGRELLELGRWRLHRAEIAPLHFSLGHRETLSGKKKGEGRGKERKGKGKGGREGKTERKREKKK